MEIKDLEARVEKKQADVEKTKRIIDKYIAANNFSEEDQEVARTASYREAGEYAAANWPGRWEPNGGKHQDPDKRIDFDNLCTKYCTLAEQETTLLKYQNQLAMMKAREEERSNTERVPVILEFLENWKNDVIEFVEEDVNNITKYYELEHESCDFHNNRYSIMRDAGMSEEEWARQYKDLNERVKRAKALPSSLTWMVYSRNADDHVNQEELNRILDKEVESKYWSMVNKVTDITGEIVDARGLRIAGDGNLNGIIIGKDGKAKLETILAGGYNQGIIVNVKHGQILHFRVLVREVK